MIKKLPINPCSPQREKCSIWDEPTDTYYMLYLLGMATAARENKQSSAGFKDEYQLHSYNYKQDFHILNYLNFAARRTKRELVNKPQFGGNELKDIKNAIKQIDYYISLACFEPFTKNQLLETRANLIKKLNE